MDNGTSETPNLTNCDREPIHIPGSILPHGAMLVADPATFVIEQVAGDTATLFGEPAAALLGRSLDDLLSPGQAMRLRSMLAVSAPMKPRHLLDPLLRIRAEHPADASVHLSGGALVIEWEHADLDDINAADPLACVQDMLAGLAEAPDLLAYCQLAADRVRGVTGYDRVMVYRFMDDDSGWVFAEARREDLTPFLDLRYPASDIPRQARALYVKSWLRLITQVNETPAPLIPAINPRSGHPLDMSHATLRDVSPIHREYLRNMGVDASMSISIVREGRLWGLIACHHYTPRRLPRHLRAVCELFGSMLSLQLEVRLRAEQFEARLVSRQALRTMTEALARQDDYAAGLVAQSSPLRDYILNDRLAAGHAPPCGGLAIRVDNGITLVGETPDAAAVGALTDWLSGEMDGPGGVYATDRLGEVWPDARAFAGVGSGLLAVSVSREQSDFILWFRPEAVATVTWGGDPRKPVEAGPNGDRVTPRKSFEAWTEIVRGRSVPWTDADRDAAFDLRIMLLEVVLRRIESATRERQRAWEQERLLMAELDHRVKNTLANIQALVRQTSRGAATLADFAAGLDRRISAMSRAHSLLTESRWEGVSVASLLHEELDPYARRTGVITVAGPAVVLTPKAALSLSLAVHELVTNAAKYGALSVDQATVAVVWTVTEDGGVVLTWTERGGPVVAEPTHRGFGSTLIERALAIETEGRSTLTFAASGVVCAIALPAAAIVRVADMEPGTAGPVAAPESVEPGPPDSLRILVVEDSALVLMLVEEVIADLGWIVVGPAARLPEALRMARSETFDAALLDINLDGAMSWDVATILNERGIPFAFTTGYDGSTVLPDRFKGQRLISKPYKIADLERGLREMVAAGSSVRR